MYGEGKGAVTLCHLIRVVLVTVVWNMWSSSAFCVSALPGAMPEMLEDDCVSRK